MKMIRYKANKPRANSSRIKPKIKRIEVNRMSVVIERPTPSIIAPMARMKQMAQEAMKAKGMTEKDVRKILGIKKYEQD